MDRASSQHRKQGKAARRRSRAEDKVRRQVRRDDAHKSKLRIFREPGKAEGRS